MSCTVRGMVGTLPPSLVELRRTQSLYPPYDTRGTKRAALALLRNPAEQLLLLGLSRCHDAVRRDLDHALHARQKLLALQARRDRIEKLDDQRAGIAHEGAAWPEQAAVECDGQAGHTTIDIDHA